MSSFIQPAGNYRQLASYQKSVVIYDLTYDFCNRYLAHGDRTIDQMVQAARSCKQNIVEGSVAAAGSAETEYRLTCVARASLEELLEDYLDYLRTRGKSIWSITDVRVNAVRDFSKSGGKTYDDFKKWIESQGNMDEAEWLCNTCISLIHQARLLLDRQKERILENFEQTGGVKEKMLHARLETRIDQREKALAALREVYRELSAIGRKDLMEKIEFVASAIKRNM